MNLSLHSARIQTCICFFLIAATVLMEHDAGLDMAVQQYWYDVASGLWTIDPATHRAWRWLFYDGMKFGVAAVGGLSIVLFCCGCIRNRAVWRRTGLLMALSCAATPLLVASLKAVTGIPCPRELVEFGGQAVGRHLLTFSSGLSGGRCFPGGHASGGFALTMLFFCLSGRWSRAAALILTLGAGWVMGLYQMMRGEHFLSHTVMSMILAWQMNILLVLLADRVILPAMEKRRRPASG